MSLYIPAPDYGRSEETIDPPSYDDYQDSYSKPLYNAPGNLIPPPDYGNSRMTADVEMNYDRNRNQPMNVYTYEEAVPPPKAPEVRKHTPYVYEPETPLYVNTTSADNYFQFATPEESPQETSFNGHQIVEEPAYAPKVEKVRDPIVPNPSNVARHGYIPKLPPKDNFIAHSYLEDKDKIKPSNEPHKSVRSHIRSIGVPVLPPIGGNPPEMDFSGAHENKVFIRHLENHRNFDTLKSLRSCRECPLCQMMAKEGLFDLETGAIIEKQLSKENQKSRRGDVRDLFAQAEASSNWVRTRRSYTERSEGEMSVQFREQVEILQREASHVLCRKTDGTLGWLPVYVIQ